MRKVIQSLTLAVAFMFVFVTGVLAAEKFGFVDISKAFDSYNKTKDYDKVLEKEQSAKEKERDKKETAVKKLEEKISLLKDGKEKDKKIAELEKERQSLYEYMQKASVDLRKERDERIKEILLDVQDVIDDYAEKNKYTMIFNDRVLLYVNQELDITDKIIDVLNKQHKGKK